MTDVAQGDNMHEALNPVAINAITMMAVLCMHMALWLMCPLWYSVPWHSKSALCR